LQPTLIIMLQGLRRQSVATGIDASLGNLLWPQPTPESLKAQYIGTDVRDLDGPAVILDLAVLKRNCDLMLNTTEALQLGFRAHIKTHKVSTCSLNRDEFIQPPTPGSGHCIRHSFPRFNGDASIEALGLTAGHACNLGWHFCAEKLVSDVAS
jgi:hypothetical protein